MAGGDSCNVTCNDIDSEQAQQLSETYTCVGKNEWHPVFIPHQYNGRCPLIYLKNNHLLFVYVKPHIFFALTM